jgi:hypothetical protein
MRNMDDPLFFNRFALTARTVPGDMNHDAEDSLPGLLFVDERTAENSRA